MRYVAPVEPLRGASAGARSVGADDLDDLRIVEPTHMEHGVVRSGSRRWTGILVGITVAATGFGIVYHGSEPPVRGPARDVSEATADTSATPRCVDGANETGDVALDIGDQPVVVTEPADGATVTSGVTMTGGVVVINATTRRELGMIHASVAIGGLVLGSRDVDVETIGPFAYRIPLFPPPF